MKRDEAPEPVRVWRRLAARMGDPNLTSRDGRRRTTAANAASKPYGRGRDPKGIGDIVQAFTRDMGWSEQLAKGDLLARWATLVGPDLSTRTEPIGIDGDVLVVQCESTAWATQMRLLRAELLTRLLQEFPDARVTAIRFNGPDVPSFKRGFRSVPGRGPRDTYG